MDDITKLPGEIIREKFPFKSFICDYAIIELPEKESIDEYSEYLNDESLLDRYDHTLLVKILSASQENIQELTEILDDLESEEDGEEDIERLTNSSYVIIAYNICIDCGEDIIHAYEKYIPEDALDTLCATIYDFPYILFDIINIEPETIQREVIGNISNIIRKYGFNRFENRIEYFTAESYEPNDTFAGNFELGRFNAIFNKYIDDVEPALVIFYNFIAELAATISFTTNINNKKFLYSEKFDSKEYNCELIKTEFGSLYYFPQGFYIGNKK